MLEYRHHIIVGPGTLIKLDHEADPSPRVFSEVPPSYLTREIRFFLIYCRILITLQIHIVVSKYVTTMYTQVPSY
jgi:hypothetical protein